MLTPRRKLACRICTRRKVRCDKQIPCNNCVKRGEHEECRRDQSVEPIVEYLEHAATSGKADESTTVNRLRSRVAELEAALQQKNAESDTIRSSPLYHPRDTTAAREERQPSSPPRDSEIEDAATVLEFLAWGRVKDPERARLSPETLRLSERDERTIIQSPAEGDIDTVLDATQTQTLLPYLQTLLPSKHQVTQLVEYHNDCLLWFHGSYFAASFSQQLQSFYHDHDGNLDSPGVDLQWIALLFSILAGTMTSAPVEEARRWRFSEHEGRVLSHKWYRAVLSSLNAADYTAQHSIYSVQAIATLTGTAHILGHSNSQSVLLASAVRIAQSLGLHRLSEEARGDEVELETGRRLWQQLCTQDWFSTSFSETYSISELHSSSAAPRNCNDDLIVMPDSTPTVTSFCRFLAEIAAIMPRLQDGMASSNTLYTKHEQVLLYDRKMRSIATDARPAFLAANTPVDETWPCYISWARGAITMSSAHKIIMIHRKFLSLSFTNPVFSFTRRTCLAASKTILKEYFAIDEDAMSPIFWTHQAFSVAACIIICLDILHQSSPTTATIDSQFQLVTRAVEILEASQKRSMIASRGVKLLKALQKQIVEITTTTTTTNGHKRHADTTGMNDDGGASSRKRRREFGFDVSRFVRSFCNNAGDEKSRRRHANLALRREVFAEDLPRAIDGDVRSQSRSESQSQDAHSYSQSFDTTVPPLDFNNMFPDMSLNGLYGSQPFEDLLFLANQSI